ncbi:MAG: hydantoinase/oxoprolinase family protein [Alphaproteobacteria bacterium]|nr:hydantoinase/oxoprolinase family protein [Alphaproteobacteria bacterium]
MSWLIGVDVGGTFTDFFAASTGDGTLHYYKRPSTPRNPGEAVVAGLREMCEAFEIDPQTIQQLCHGTTVATNALIQRRGGAVAMITTAGFRDLLEIGRQTRPHMYSLQNDQPAPLIPRQRRFEVLERVNSSGEAVVALDESSLPATFDAIEQSGAQACAVCFLFSFMNDAHEQRIGKLLRKHFPQMHVCLSSQVRPEFREYERFSTTVLNAYLQPVVGDYLGYLDVELSEFAPAAPMRIYQSSGGLMSVDTAKNFPIRTALSGPAAGAVGAIHAARDPGRPNVVTLDMGGTSADVTLIRNNDAGISLDRDVAGFPVRLPMVDIHSVGAGGGSIAWFDRDELLKVGPSSAGADPGPACYDRGGTEPTVTDANLVLGRLSEGGLIGGQMALDGGASRKAIQPIADRLGFTVEKAAQGIIGIVVANMVRAVRTMSVERGLDPRDYTLMPFGGAGPLHAVEVARVLSMKEILVPIAPGILCAQGLIVSDLKEDFVRSGRFAVDVGDETRLTLILEELAAEARDWFQAEQIATEDQRLTVTLDARYVGQNFELPVIFREVEPGTLPIPADSIAVIDRFNAVHERYYGFQNAGEPVEIVNIRLTAVGRLGSIPAPLAPLVSDAAPNAVDRRPVWFDGNDPVNTSIYERTSLAAGMRFPGPAVIEQLDSTTIVFPGDEVSVDTSMNLIISVDLDRGAAE